jgi:regulator of PEP synthase PpsR (kinase-PPPase family)
MFLKLFKGLIRVSYRGEEKMSDIPVPLINYIHLIKDRKSPYYEIVEHLMKEMEMHYTARGQGSEAVYTINPRMLQEEIEKKVSDERVTTVNVCRTILALLYGAQLDEEKDFFVTTTSSGRKNYHIRVTNRTLNSMSKLL